ncbi:hypothetical protein DM02DRAFT_611178 [Periconia macrospinosa]|uniref:Peptide hydrolase n=1 Tax=Periconia macrospinosa TaxID=97972 RepID=A0A2V1E2M0_9PLEO|nr:hypothetical protein DM02DRAFT_611178 [Periconia macrospinosa]
MLPPNLLPTTLLATLPFWLPLTTAYTPLSESFLRAIPSPGDAFSIETTTTTTNTSLLAPLLIPRVPGTPGQQAAQAHLFNFFTTNLPAWNLTWQNSTSTTPATGSRQIPFANLIARRDPPWTKAGETNFLTLVAHYDSKLTPEGFIGATDSAAPCAILMWTAQVVDKYLTQMYDEMSALGEGGELAMDMGLQILFLDGEEAFVQWTDTDSLYGSRSLANQWSLSANPLPQQKFYKYRNPLSQISLFVLLDLLGEKGSKVPSYMPTTHWAYVALATVESRLRQLNLLETSSSSSSSSSSSQPTKNAPEDENDPSFLPDLNSTTASAKRAGISDDHLPFIHRGVETLHLIPKPFPNVWHTMEDDGAHLDLATVRDWARVMVGFVGEWLDLMEVWTEPEAEGEGTTTA